MREGYGFFYALCGVVLPPPPPPPFFNFNFQFPHATSDTLAPLASYLYGGDGVFFQQLVDSFGEGNTTIVPELIYHLGQSEDLFAQAPDLLKYDNSQPVPDVTPEDDARIQELLRGRPEAAGMPKWMQEQQQRGGG
jgi:hypothetical protein